MRKTSYAVKLLVFSVVGLLLTGISGCGDDDNPITPDQTRPTVSSTFPASAATNVSMATNITATFSEATESSTITSNTFMLKQGATAVAGAVSNSASPGATFNPTDALLPNTVYTATITTGAEDLAGNGLLADYTWSFTTGTVADVTPPTVVSMTPQNGAVNVATNTTLTATFSEVIDATTVTGTTFVVRRGAATAVAGTVSYSGHTATFVPSAALVIASDYTATLTTAVSDPSGNALAVAHVWAFSTVAATDGSAPTVSLTVPANAATNISVSANVLATFSEAMNAATITTSTFTLKQGATSVGGAVSFSGGTATFNPTSNLTVNTAYTATITTGAMDQAGNALGSAYVWTFTTSAAPDITPPSVISTVPVSGAINVSTATNITATFSEAMNPPTISSATVTVMQGTINYDGLVTYFGNTLTFNPVSALAPGEVFTVTISTGATDLAGNALAANYSWTFTTFPVAPPPDITPPTVINTVPANGATLVSTAASLSVDFSEAIDPSSVSAASFKLRAGATQLAGAVSYSGTTAVFVPAVSLVSEIVYSASITTDVKDLAGNHLAVNHEWEFTTAGSVVVGAPTVVAFTPENEGINISTVASITATFSETMNPSSLSTSTFIVEDDNGMVSGVVTYSGFTATFNPSIRLSPSQFYSATITTGATDDGGVALDSDFVWVFSTEDIPAVTGVVPTVDGLNVPITAKIAASFTKPMNAASLTTESFVIRNSVTWIPGTVTTVGPAVVFDPNGNLEPNTVYTAQLTTSATDLSGNPLGSDVVWSFTTGTAVDVTRPIVTASDPAQGEVGVPRGATIRAYFNDAIDPTTLTNLSFIVTSVSGQAVGVISYPETIALFTPTVLLEANTQYTVFITTAVKDISGNALSPQMSWTFTTGP